MVLFTDDYLKKGRGWPARFADHSLVLNRIARHQPAAVFYDILFAKRYDETGVDGFVRTIDRVKKKGINIITPYDKFQVGIDSITESVSANALTGWNGHGVFYPPQVNGQKTVAFDMYNRWLLSNNKDAELPQFKSDMFIMWGVRGLKSSRFFEKFLKGIEYTRPMKNTDQKGYIDTAYINSIKVSELNKVDSGDLKKMIKNKIVLIGTNLNGVSDFYTTSLYGLVPGVFVHAMAFDNLVNYQADYYKDGDSFAFLGIDLPSLLEIFVLGILLFIGKFTSDKESYFHEKGVFEKLIETNKENIIIIDKPENLNNKYLHIKGDYCYKDRVLLIGKPSDIKDKIMFKNKSILNRSGEHLISSLSCFLFKFKWFILSVIIIVSAMMYITLGLRSDPGNFIGLITADLVGYTLIESMIEIIILFCLWIFYKLIGGKFNESK